ncbi:MAG: signal peptidase II [Micrococcales bacterium]
MTKQQRRTTQIIVLSFAILVVILDQLSKALVIKNFEPGKLSPMLGDLVQFNLVFNDSAAFSLGFGATQVFAVISSVAALVLLWYSARVETKSWALLVGIALGGVTGNLIDRLIREPGFGKGLVVDFIQIPFNFPVFNLADTAIFCVAVVTIIRVLRGDRIGKAGNQSDD